MQNDLISKSTFRKLLIEKQISKENFNNIERRTAIGSVIDLLDKQPVDCNMETFVDELIKELEELERKGTNTIGAHYYEAGVQASIGKVKEVAEKYKRQQSKKE